MSRLIKKPIVVADNCKIEYKDRNLTISGATPDKKLSLVVSPEVELKFDGKKIFVLPKNGDLSTREMKMVTGLVWALIRNMAVGVSQGYTKNLEIRGVGYNAQRSGNNLVLKLGFTHLVQMPLPAGIEVKPDQKGITMAVTGIDKQAVGEFAAKIRRILPPESYKGTGIRYVNEHVIKKVGKAAVGTGAGAAGGGGGKGTKK
jgi:large subunit ribosomal protein L6